MDSHHDHAAEKIDGHRRADYNIFRRNKQRATGQR